MRVDRSLPGLGPLVLGLLALAPPAPGADYRGADPAGKAHLIGCGSGFPDLSGKCWKCPDGYRHDNIFLTPTDERVCKRAGQTEFRSGEKQRPSTVLTCPAGEWVSFHDASCYKCRDGYSHDLARTGNDGRVCFRTSDSYSRANEAGGILCDRGFFDPIDGGTCWTCPPSHPHRTARPVNSRQACTDELDGILAVDASAVCTEVVNALAEGEKGVRRLTNTLGILLRPVMAPLDEGVRALNERIQTPAEVEKVVERLAQSLQPYGEVVEEVQRLSDVLDQKGMELRRILLDPQLMCRGRLGGVNQRLEGLGLRPWPRRKSGWLDGLLVGDVQAAGKHPYVAFALSWNVMLGKVPVTMGVTFVTDFREDAGLLWSVGSFLGASGLKDIVGFNASVLVFPYADLGDFVTDIADGVEWGALSAELDFDPDERLTALLARIGARKVPDTVTLSFDPNLLRGRGVGPDSALPGIGASQPIQERSGRTQTALKAIPMSASLDVSLWIARHDR